jgi:hypothetical protein
MREGQKVKAGYETTVGSLLCGLLYQTSIFLGFSDGSQPLPGAAGSGSTTCKDDGGRRPGFSNHLSSGIHLTTSSFSTFFIENLSRIFPDGYPPQARRYDSVREGCPIQAVGHDSVGEGFPPPTYGHDSVRKGCRLTAFANNTRAPDRKKPMEIFASSSS